MVAPEQTLPAGGGVQTARYGEIYDRGYQHYEGARLGRTHAFWALVRYSMKRAVGIKKGWTSKIIPIFLYVSVTLVVVIPLGVMAFIPSASVLEYWDFFNFIFLILGIFVATIAPEMLCGDRRENVLPLYFSRAITRLDYLLAKLVATALLTLTISVVPCAIYWLGRQLLEDSPLSGIKDNADDLGRIVIAGVVISAYLGSIGLTIASFTGRKSIAVAITVVGFGISSTLAYALAAALESDTERFLVFLSPGELTNWFVYRVFDRPLLFESTGFGQFLSLEGYAAGMIATIVVGVAVMLWRYVPDE